MRLFSSFLGGWLCFFGAKGEQKHRVPFSSVLIFFGFESLSYFALRRPPIQQNSLYNASLNGSHRPVPPPAHAALLSHFHTHIPPIQNPKARQTPQTKTKTLPTNHHPHLPPEIHLIPLPALTNPLPRPHPQRLWRQNPTHRPFTNAPHRPRRPAEPPRGRAAAAGGPVRFSE